MQDWLIRGNAYGDPSYMRRYIQSLTGSLPKAVNQYYRDHNLSYQSLTLAEAQDHINKVIQKQCLARRMQKEFKDYNKLFTNYVCNTIGDMPNWEVGKFNRPDKHSKCLGCSSKKKKPWISRDKWKAQ